VNPDRHMEVKRCAGGETAVLFVHGIQGSPCQFRFLTDALKEDISFHNLLLPGHGGDYSAFKRSGLEQWQRAVNEAAEELREKYKKVYFVGHSMGCLLGLRTCIKANISFDGMLLIACPLKLRFTLRYLTHNYLTIIIKNPRNPYMKASAQANSISAKYPWQYFSCVHPYLELLKLIKLTRRELRSIPVSIQAVHMAKDEIISARSLDVLKSAGRISRTVYPVCGHNYFTDEAKADMIGKLLTMIGN